MNKETNNSTRTILLGGIVIPAHPLALTGERKLDEKHQRALTRYYLESGARGIAIGVHTTQFSIRDKKYGLYKPLLELTMEEIRNHERKSAQSIVKIAGVVGSTDNAIKEAILAKELGYDAALLKLDNSIVANHRGNGEKTIELTIKHCKEVASVIPLFGFYLQPALGGMLLPFEFWKKFLEEIENVLAIKIATFNRYLSIDVVRALIETKRENEVALYTGNDDNIIQDLITPFTFKREGRAVRVFIRGGLLGQWAVWTKRAVQLLEEIKQFRENTIKPSGEKLFTYMRLNVELTDANGAIFDARNNYRGAIPGVLEVLKRAGLVSTNLCLNPEEKLSPGQSEEIERVISSYPHLTDNSFVKENLHRWLEG